MRKHAGLIFIATVALVVAVIIASVALKENEPRHKGKPLSFWIERFWYFGPEGGIAAHVEAQEALHAIGTNAFPLLLCWIRMSEPKRPDAIREIAVKLPNPLRPEWAREHYIPHSKRAVLVIGILEDEAAGLVPELARLAAENAEGAEDALIALMQIGSSAVPALLAAVRNPSHPNRVAAIYRLVQGHDLGPYTNLVIRELIAQLGDPGLDGEPALALGNSEIPKELVAPTLVPALARCLGDTNSQVMTRIHAAIALRDFDEKSINALPALTNALNDPDGEVRKEAATTIEQIHGAILRPEQK